MAKPQKQPAKQPEQNQDGAPSSSEQNPPGEIYWAHSIVELADTLRVSRQTIYNWQQLPGCLSARSSGNYYVPEWRAFQEELGTTDDDEQSPKKRALEERLLKTKCETAEFKLQVQRGEYTHNPLIADEINRLASELSTMLKNAFEERLPKRPNSS